MTVAAVLIFHRRMDFLFLIPGVRRILVPVALEAQAPVVPLQRGDPFLVAGPAVPFPEGCVLEGKEKLSLVRLVGEVAEGALRRVDIQATVGGPEGGVLPMALETYGIYFPREGEAWKAWQIKHPPSLMNSWVKAASSLNS